MANLNEGPQHNGGNKPETNTPRTATTPKPQRGGKMSGKLYQGIEVGVVRNEQWEHTAMKWGMGATGYGENDAVLNLFAKRIKQLEKALDRVAHHSSENDYCFVCDNHISSGHSPDCALKDFFS